MEFRNFLKSLRRYRAILILVPVITAVLAFFISKKLPDKYTSHARLTTALADKSQQLVSDNMQQESRINLEFDNLLQTLTLNKVVDRVSYKLILHDLTDNQPFSKPSKLLAGLSTADRQAAIKTFSTYYDERRSLNQADPSEKGLYKLLKSMKYDDESLRKAVTASRMENSQYLNMEYSSESPQLSAFVLNTLSEEFINYYTTVSISNKSKSVNFLDSLLKEKQTALAQQTEALKRYKIENGVLNVDEQAKTIYGEMAEVEAKRGNAQKDMIAYNVALKNIESKFTPENKKYFEGSMSGLNSDIVNTKEQIKAANDAYVQNGFSEKYKARVDSLQSKLTRQIYAQTDNYASNPNATKDNLVAQKLNMEVSRDLAANSVQTLDNQLGKMNQSLQKLVPNLATIQAMQAKIEVANKEYLDVLQKYNQASLEANYNLPIRIVEKALPGDAAPSKKIVMVVLSAIVSLMLCLFVFFIRFYFDNSVQSSEQLENLVDIPVIGSLNHVGRSLNLQELWNPNPNDKQALEFKNSLRSIRYELEQKLEDRDDNVITVTSLNEGEGKTFFTESLAYAFSKMNKKVLIIDGNFMHPDITETIHSANYIEKFLLENNGTKMVDNDLITILGNKGGDGSLLELNNSRNIKDFFSVLKTVYDVIIIESSALESTNKANAKEWISFSDKVLVVFEAGRKLDETAAKHIQYLKNLGGKLSGMVMNKVVTAPSAINFNLLLDKPKNEQTVYS